MEPVPLFDFHPFRRMRSNRESITGPTVETDDVTTLRLGIDDIGVGWINLLIHAIAEIDLKPVAVQNPNVISRRARSTPRMGVLRATVDVVGSFHIDAYCIKLCYRNVRNFVPSFAAIPRKIQPSVPA